MHINMYMHVHIYVWHQVDILKSTLHPKPTLPHFTIDSTFLRFDQTEFGVNSQMSSCILLKVTLWMLLKSQPRHSLSMVNLATT